MVTAAGIADYIGTISAKYTIQKADISKTIKVKVGAKKQNQKYVKKNSKIFTRKNCGRKVRIR